MYDLKCRFCAAPLQDSFIDLGTSPVANSYVAPGDVLKIKMEPFFALHAFVCRECFLVQVPLTETREHIFNDEYVVLFRIGAGAFPRLCRGDGRPFGFGAGSHVIEVASNDGYLLNTSRSVASRSSASSPRAASPRRRSPPASRAASPSSAPRPPRH